MTLEYTIERGWDQWTFAGYLPSTHSTPEEAIEACGVTFHPDFDSVVRREVGTEKWEYSEEDQKYDRAQKIDEYRAAKKG